MGSVMTCKAAAKPGFSTDSTTMGKKSHDTNAMYELMTNTTKRYRQV